MQPTFQPFSYKNLKNNYLGKVNNNRDGTESGETSRRNANAQLRDEGTPE